MGLNRIMDSLSSGLILLNIIVGCLMFGMGNTMLGILDFAAAGLLFTVNQLFPLP